jgi:hypothetical protein
MHLQPLGRNRHIVPVMHVLKTDVPNIVIGQFLDFLGHLALQDAGQPFIDLLPMNGTGWEVILKNLGESSDYLILLSRINILQPDATSRFVPRRRGVRDTSSGNTCLWNDPARGFPKPVSGPRHRGRCPDYFQSPTAQERSGSGHLGVWRSDLAIQLELLLVLSQRLTLS